MPRTKEQRVPVELVKNKSPEEKEKFISSYRAFSGISTDIKKILEGKIRDNTSTCRSDLEKPNYSLRRAYQDGYAQAMKEVANLLP